jgi:hypothetical protein
MAAASAVQQRSLERQQRHQQLQLNEQFLPKKQLMRRALKMMARNGNQDTFVSGDTMNWDLHDDVDAVAYTNNTCS